jgi:hypothetical protein
MLALFRSMREFAGVLRSRSEDHSTVEFREVAENIRYEHSPHCGAFLKLHSLDFDKGAMDQSRCENTQCEKTTPPTVHGPSFNQYTAINIHSATPQSFYPSVILVGAPT